MNERSVVVILIVPDASDPEVYENGVEVVAGLVTVHACLEHQAPSNRLLEAGRGGRRNQSSHEVMESEDRDIFETRTMLVPLTRSVVDCIYFLVKGRILGGGFPPCTCGHDP